MSEKQFEDELVRIEAESEEALRKGFKNGKLKVPEVLRPYLNDLEYI